MRSAVIVGARPNFVKVAPLLRALRALDVETVLIHTGQHYDWAMSESLFADLGIPAPDVNLGVGSSSHAVQTARVMTSFEEWLGANPVDQIVTVGDVNSTLACTLVGAKGGVPVAHVEAGLRSFDRGMPEETNRVVVDALSQWLFTPSLDANANLLAEGVHPSRIHFAGNIMVDSLITSLERAMASDVLTRLRVEGPYALATLHRPALVNDRAQLARVLGALAELASKTTVIFPVHPRTQMKIAGFGLDALANRVQLTTPLGYLDFLRLEAGASLVLTDSGGVQEETTVLGVPCLTLRENTERPITITQGTNHLVGLDPARIRVAAAEALGRRMKPVRPPLWDGHTAPRIAETLSRPASEVSWVPPALAEALRGRGVRETSEILAHIRDANGRDTNSLDTIGLDTNGHDTNGHDTIGLDTIGEAAASSRDTS